MNAEQAILVTGGTGFAGLHLLRALNQAGYQNLHASYAVKPPEWNLSFKVGLHGVDLTDIEATQKMISEVKPAQLYQLASLSAVGKSFEHANQILSNNIVLQRNVLEAVCTVSPTTRILCVGSADCYGYIPPSTSAQPIIDETFPMRPMNPYAVSKAAQDMLADAYFLSYGLDIVRVRPFNHIGTGQTPDFVVSAFASQIAKIEKGQQAKVEVGNLEAVRDFSDVRDVVRAYITVMEKGSKGDVYNIGSGQGWKIADLLATLVGMATVPIQVETDPTRLRPAEVSYFVGNISKMSALGWQPQHQLKDTLLEILNEWRQRV